MVSVSSFLGWYKAPSTIRFGGRYRLHALGPKHCAGKRSDEYVEKAIRLLIDERKDGAQQTKESTRRLVDRYTFRDLEVQCPWRLTAIAGKGIWLETSGREHASGGNNLQRMTMNTR
jgi:hypothetical protein